MEPRLKIDVDTGGSSTNGNSSGCHEERDQQPQSSMPPPSSDWNNQYSSPDAVSPKGNGNRCFSPYSQEDMGPFVEQLLPYVRASAYNWFHLQAAKRRHFKKFDRKMSASDENRKLVELQNDRDELKVKWASRLLGKIKKDIHNDHKDAFVTAINGQRPAECILSVADQKGKMRRIDCLRQADKVWRLDLVTIILFKGIPLESTDGERLERCESCIMPNLCINPFHISISVRGLDIFLAKYLKDIDTKIVMGYDSKQNGAESVDQMVVKQEPGEQSIVAPHAVLGTSATHNRVWETPIVLEYDPQRACHTYFGGRAPYVQQSAPSAYNYFLNKDAVDNNYFDPKRAVLCLPPPPAQSCVTTNDFPEANTSESQPLENSEDSNDEPLEKRSRDMSSHDSPNSSTNDEVRRIVETGENRGLILGQSSTIWSPSGNYARVQQASQSSVGPGRNVRIVNDFRNEATARNASFRPAKSVRRMTVNAGNHGDVGVVVVDARNQDVSLHAQSLVNALNCLRTSPAMLRASPIGVGRKRVHPQTSSPLNVLSAQCVSDALKGTANLPSSDVLSPNSIVSNVINRESSGYMASPTKFTTARGDTTSFSKILQKVEEKHGQQQSQQHSLPSTSYCPTQMHPSFIISSKPPESSVKLIAPVALKPQMMPLSACSSIVASPITTPRITPFRMLEDDSQSFANVLGQLTNSNDSIQDQFLQYINDSNSRSPMLSAGAATTFSALTMGAASGLPTVSSITRPDSSASNGSNSLTGAMGLTAPPNITLAVSQTLTSMSPHPVLLGIPQACSPSSSNSSLGAANQPPLSRAPKDPNAPKLPTDFSQALRNEKK